MTSSRFHTAFILTGTILMALCFAQAVHLQQMTHGTDAQAQQHVEGRGK